MRGASRISTRIIKDTPANRVGVHYLFMAPRPSALLPLAGTMCDLIVPRDSGHFARKILPQNSNEIPIDLIDPRGKFWNKQ